MLISFLIFSLPPFNLPVFRSQRLQKDQFTTTIVQLNQRDWHLRQQYTDFPMLATSEAALPIATAFIQFNSQLQLPKYKSNAMIANLDQALPALVAQHSAT